MRSREFNDLAREQFNMDLYENNKETLPETEEELQLHMQLNYKQAVELAEEQAINVLMEGSNYDLIRRRCLYDLTTIGVAASKTTFDFSEGAQVEYVDPVNLVHSYTDSPYFEDLYYVGEVKEIPINELVKEFPDLTESEIADYNALQKETADLKPQRQLKKIKQERKILHNDISDMQGNAVHETILNTAKKDFVEDIIAKGKFQFPEDKEVLETGPTHKYYDHTVGRYFWKDHKTKKGRNEYSPEFQEFYNNEKEDRNNLIDKRLAAHKEFEAVLNDPNSTIEQQEEARAKLDLTLSELKTKDGKEDYFDDYADVLLNRNTTAAIKEMNDDLIDDLSIHKKKIIGEVLNHLKNEKVEKVEKDHKKFRSD